MVELYSRLEKNEEQLTYYDSGIGTYVKESNGWRRFKQSLAHNWDMAVAWYAYLITTFAQLMQCIYTRNLKKIINAYQWLSENYKDGDRIFLFGKYRTLPCILIHTSSGCLGFSRGAYQVRIIAGMITKVQNGEPYVPVP